MKKLITISLILLGVTTLHAQIDLHGVYGWQWGGKVNGYDPLSLRSAEFRVESAEYYGVGLDFVTPKQITIQLQYTRQESTITKKVTGEPKEELTDAIVEYWQIGGLRTLTMDRIEPYGGLLLGMAVLKPSAPIYSNRTMFAVTLKGGLKIWLTEKVGIKGEIGMLMPMQWGGFSFGCGGGGCGTGVSTYTTIVQGQVGGGLVLRAWGGY